MHNVILLNGPSSAGKSTLSKELQKRLREKNKESVIISIDELEGSLHPDLFEHFLLTFLLNAKNSQLLATTHYREILNKKDFFRNDAIWFTERNQQSATELYSLTDFDSSVVRDTTNVYNAYKMGKFGAIPMLKDTYLDVESHEKQ